MKLDIPLALLVAIFVVGCGTSTTPETLMSEAREFRNKGELKSALIQAKNAAQLAPDLAEAHFLKGLIYLELGEPRAAEDALRKALSLKMDRQVATPALAKALLAQGKYDDALDETAPERVPNAKISAELASLRGNAFLGLRRIPAAKSAYESALQTEPDLPEALLGLAKITAAERHPEDAMKLLERALSKAPNDFDALLFEGDLYRVLQKPEAAAAAYEKAIRQKPDDLNARLTLASVQIGLNKDAEAAGNLAVVLLHEPQSPTANYLQALLELRKKNYREAQNRAAEVLKVQPTHFPSVVLAGAAEYAAGDYARAEAHLKWALGLNPKDLYVRRLLVAAYGRNNRIPSAIDEVLVGLKQAPQDLGMLELAGDVYMRANQFESAAHYFDSALDIQPRAIGNRLGASVSRLASGEVDRVVADLEPLVSADPGQSQAGILLAMAQLRRGDFDKALDLITKLERDLPSNPIVRNLKGSAYVGKKDYAGARRAFEEALARQGSFFPAAANLAQLDIRNGDYAAARKRYEAVLDSDGSNVQALLAIAELINRVPGHTEEALNLVERARALQANDPRIVLILAKYQLATGNRPRALELMRFAAKVGKFDPKVLGEVVQLQLATGDMRDAMATYGDLVRSGPPSAETLFRLASIQYLVGNVVIAKQTLLQALDLDPNMLDGLILLAKLEAAAGNRTSAVNLVERVRKRSRNSLSAWVLEGDVEMLSKRYASAARAYERAYAIQRDGLLAAQIHQAYVRAGKSEQGESVVLKWLQENPNDDETRQYLADASMRGSRLFLAIGQYEWLAQRQPGNQQVLNNLAWAYQQTSDPRALATAERAFQLNESTAPVADTYGWILYRNARLPESVAVLKRATTLAPDALEIRYHYAQALASSGERKEARIELERVLAGPPFERRAEAASLLNQLKN
jgi:putative PEP-CTERM system TPR-repeat lipoprotein